MKGRETNRLRIWTRLLPVLLWMLVIYFMSSQPYEKQSLKPWLQKHVNEEAVKKRFGSVQFQYGMSEVSIDAKGSAGFIEFFIRKSAHAAEYGILGMLVIRWLASVWKSDIPKLMLIALLICAAYAGLDEFHQSFTSNRTPMALDVLLDAAGAAAGIILFCAFARLRSKRGVQAWQ